MYLEFPCPEVRNEKCRNKNDKITVTIATRDISTCVRKSLLDKIDAKMSSFSIITINSMCPLIVELRFSTLMVTDFVLRSSPESESPPKARHLDIVTCKSNISP